MSNECQTLLNSLLFTLHSLLPTPYSLLPTPLLPYFLLPYFLLPYFLLPTPYSPTPYSLLPFPVKYRRMNSTETATLRRMLRARNRSPMRMAVGRRGLGQGGDGRVCNDS